MISIISRPYDGLSTKYSPVYNGLPFVVTSDMKYTPSFRYICEIYTAAGSKIGELRHNPNISSGENGIFDIGRILEDYITYELPWKAKGITIPYSAYKDYYVSFGEEVNRGGKITTSLAGNIIGVPGSKASFVLSTPLIYGSYVSYGNVNNNGSILIQGTSNATLNRAWKVYDTRFSSNGVILNTPFIAGVNVSSAYAIQGFWTNFSTYIGEDGMTYYQFTYRSNADVFISSGDTITTIPDDTTNTYTTFLNNTTWNIKSITQTSISGSMKTYTVKTNIPYQTDISSSTIHIFPLNNAVKRDLINTKTDLAVAWNSVFQYEDLLDYQPTKWSFLAYNGTRRFLTRRPRKTISVCTDQYFTLSALGNLNMPIFNNLYTGRSFNNYDGVIVEAVSSLIYPPISTNVSFTVLSGASYKAMYSGKTLLIFNGNKSLEWTNGTYLNVAGWQKVGTVWNNANYNGIRIITSDYNSTTGRTYIVLDLGYTSIFNVDTTHPWTLTMTQRIKLIGIGLDPNAETPPSTVSKYGLATFGIGPQNMIDNTFSEFGSTITSYKVTPYSYMISQSTLINGVYKKYQPAGETWNFTISCPCDKKWKRYTLMWMNELGGFDYYDFDLPTDKNRNITRNTFNRKLKSYEGTKYTYTAGQRGTTTFDTNSIEAWTLRTDFIDQETIDWLMYIYESPEVYIIDKSYSNDFTTKQLIFPVTLTTEQPTLLDKRNMTETGSLRQMIIDVIKSNARNIQRGSNFGGSYFYNRS
jgi:hypothetical protein